MDREIRSRILTSVWKVSRLSFSGVVKLHRGQLMQFRSISMHRSDE